MAKVKGVVEAISRKKVGNGFAFSFMVNGEWYRHGFNKPKFEKGYSIMFDDEQFDYGVIDVSTIKFKKGTAPSKSSAKDVAKSGGNSKAQAENWDARAKYWEDKEKRDLVTSDQYNYRSAFHMAAEMIKQGLELDIVSVGTPKASKPKKWEAYLEMVDALAADLYVKFLTVGGLNMDNAPDMTPANDSGDIPEQDEPNNEDDWDDSSTPADDNDDDDDDWDDD